MYWQAAWWLKTGGLGESQDTLTNKAMAHPKRMSHSYIL